MLYNMPLPIGFLMDAVTPRSPVPPSRVCLSTWVKYENQPRDPSHPSRGKRKRPQRSRIDLRICSHYHVGNREISRSTSGSTAALHVENGREVQEDEYRPSSHSSTTTAPYAAPLPHPVPVAPPPAFVALHALDVLGDPCGRLPVRLHVRTRVPL